MSDSTSSEILAETAFRKQRNKNFSEALGLWEQILLHKAQDNRALFNKHKCLFYLGRYEEALHVIQVFLAKYPNYIPGHSQLVYTFLRMRKRWEAFETVVLSLSKFPNDLTLLLAKVRILISLENFDTAKKLIAKILDLYPSNTTAKELLRDITKYTTISTYHEDGLKTKHNHEFTQLPNFLDAYNRGIKAANDDYNWRWRVHVGLWAASIAVTLSGDFVECGVNKGFLSSAILQYLDWNKLDKHFYLLDTFKGIDKRYVLEEEINGGIMEKNRKELENGFYTSSFSSVKKNFEEWKNIKIIEGSIPDTLVHIKSTKIAFLHIDLNCAKPEIDAINYCWNKLVEGGVVLLDDYAGSVRQIQKRAMDKFALSVNHKILSLPTGQGLIIKNRKS